MGAVAALAFGGSSVPPNSDAVASTARFVADIAVTARVNQPQIRLGQHVTLVVTATNRGAVPATNVVVTDPLPSGLTLVSSSASVGVHDAGIASWDVGALAVGQTAMLSLFVQANTPGHMAAAATLVAVSPTDNNDLNNVDSAAVEVLRPVADLVTTEVTSEPSAAGVVTTTVSATNLGPDNVENVVVVGLGLDIVWVTVSAGTYDPASLTWTVGPLLASAAPATLTAQIVLGTAGTKAGAFVSHAPGTVDPDPMNNVVGLATVRSAPQLDIAVSATADAALVRRGQNVTFTVTAANNGASPATGLTVATGVPPGLAVVSAAGPGHFDRASSAWTIGRLDVGASVSLVITATAAAVGSSVYVAGLSRVNERDSDASNNAGSVTIAVDEAADLEITTVSAPEVVEPGDVVRHVVTVTNHGPNDSSTVEVFYPESFAADVVTVTTGPSARFGRRVWTIGALAPGESAVLEVLERVNRAGIAVTTAQIIQSRAPDPDPENNTARAVLKVSSADLLVATRPDAARIAVGAEVAFTVVATNIGPYPAHGVSVVDLLGPELSLVEASATIGIYDAATGVWQIGELPVGKIETLRIRALARWPGEVRNLAVITSISPIEPNPGNNSVETVLTINASPEAAIGPGSGGLRSNGELGWWLTGSGALGLFLVLAGAALILVRRREPLSGT